MLDDYTIMAKKTQIKSKGREVKHFRIVRKDKKIMDKSEMVKVGNEFLKLKREKLQGQGKNKHAFRHGSAVHTPWGWRSSSFENGNIKFSVYDASMLYGNEDEEHLITTGDAMSIFIYDTPPPHGGCTKNNNNDCLFYCLKYFLGDLFKVKFPASLKKLLKLKRTDPIPLSCLGKVEEQYKLNIVVEGDHTYDNEKRYIRTMYLKLKEGHYSLDKEKTMPSMSKKFRSKWIIQKDFIVYDNENIYDGEKLISRKGIQVSNYGKQYFKLSMLSFIRTKDLKEAYEILKDEIHRIEQVDTRLSPRYYYDKNGNIALMNITVDFFIYKSNGLNNPEPIGQEEGSWLMKALRGGFMYAQKGVYKNCVKYDVNSFYPSLEKNLLLPRGKPEFETIDEHKAGFGIYRCKIEPGNRMFRYSPHNYYTNYDVGLAIELNLKITMIKDGKPNFMNYGRGMPMASAFSPSIDILYDLKKKGHKLAKFYLNCLWGQLSKTTKKCVVLKDDKGFETDDDIVWMTADCKLLYTMNQEKVFMSDFGKIAPFITSKGRRYIYNHFKDHADKVLQCHTDGFILKGNVELKTSDKIGDLKLEAAGSCEVFHVNKVKWL